MYVGEVENFRHLQSYFGPILGVVVVVHLDPLDLLLFCLVQNGLEVVGQGDQPHRPFLKYDVNVIHFKNYDNF